MANSAPTKNAVSPINIATKNKFNAIDPSNYLPPKEGFTSKNSKKDLLFDNPLSFLVNILSKQNLFDLMVIHFFYSP